MRISPLSTAGIFHVASMVVMTIASALGLTTFAIMMSVFWIASLWMMITLMVWSSTKAVVLVIGMIFRMVPVELIDYECKRKFTLAKRRSNGNLRAFVYWNCDVGAVDLLPNGLVHPDSEACYIYFWLPVDRSHRTEILLTNDFPDLDGLGVGSTDDRRHTMYDLHKEYIRKTLYRS